MMRILFIDFSIPYLMKDAAYPVGGWAVQLNAWLKGLVHTEHAIGVLTWRGANNYIDQKLPFDLIETYDPGVGLKILKYFYSFIPKLYEQAKRFQPDVIIQACAGLNTGIMNIIARMINIPFVYRVASDIESDKRIRETLKFYEYLAFLSGLSGCNAIISQNTYQYSALKRKYPLKPIYTIHNPFAGGIIGPDEVRPTLAQKEYVAWLGIFKQLKNLPLLLQTAHKLPDVKFKVAGMPPASIDPSTEAALKQLSKCQNVEMVGYLRRQNVPGFLSRAIALLNTSHAEGFSNTFLESFSVGTPVITSSRVDPDEIIRRFGLGLTSDRPCQLYVLIRNLMEDQDSYSKMTRRCRDYVVNNHCPEILVNQLIKTLSTIIKK